ncbi:sugar ABC transporter substrate-binding protein [Rhodococcoides yunnanense]|uniref:sugar ABC transporter substrate-binding protein n=1 Tax=Rhodococcoides yunnanense TaxID=278209 RepID=UPI00093273CC|nr:substrate-binding domain-containing protein [Rhodococcus yunnanensis]
MSIKALRLHPAAVPRSIRTAVAGLAAVAIVTAGCTSTTTDAATTGSGNTDAAQALVDKYADADIDWAGPTESVPFAKDKKLAVVALTMTSVSNQRVAAGIEEAAALGGWDVTVFDGAGLQDKYAAGIDSAITQQFDGIALLGTQFVPEALDRAHAAGIPIVAAIDTTENPLVEKDAYTHLVWEHGDEIGSAAAAQLVVDQGADAPVITVGADGDPLGDLLIGGATDVFTEAGNPIAAHVALDFAELGTGSIGQKSVAAAQAHPDAKAFWVAWDAPAAEIVTALQSAGITVPVYSTYADPQNLEFLRSGAGQLADVAVALEWDGWAVVDNFNRIFAGTPVEKTSDDGVPIRLVTPDNIDTYLPGDATAWEGEYDFRTEYKSLWGVN